VADDPYGAMLQSYTGGGSATAPPADPASDPYAAMIASHTGAAPSEPPPPPTTARGIVRNVAAGAIDTGENVVNTASDPFGNLIGKPLATAAVFAHDLIAPLFGGERFPPDVRNALLGDTVPQPGTRAINTLGQIAGVNPDDVTANTAAERLTRKAVGAGGSVAALGPAGVTPALMGATGAIVGDQAAQAVPEWAKPAAELAGNVVGGIAAGGAAKAAGTVGNLASGERTPMVDAYHRLGMTPRLTGDITGNPTAQFLQAYSSKALGGAGRIRPLEQQAVGEFNAAVERTAQNLGGSRDAMSAGTALQTEARNWQDNVFPARQAAAWAPVDKAMASATVDPVNYRGALTSLSNKLAALPETQKAMLPARVSTMLDAINADVPAGNAMPWQQAQQLRSAIGEIMGVPEIAQSVGDKQLARMYGGLSEDMKASARAAGAGALFDQANAVSTAGHAFIDNTLSKIIRSKNPAQESIRPERATDAVLGGGDTTLQALRAEMPKAADELAAYKLRDMALATPGAAGRTGAETSVGTFLTDLNRMRQSAPNGTKALFADPAAAQAVEDLSMVADGMKETAKRANTSGTTSHAIIPEMALTAAATYHGTGSIPATIASTAGPVLANYLAARASSSPILTRLATTPSHAERFAPLSIETGALGYNALGGPDMRRLAGGGGTLPLKLNPAANRLLAR